MTRTIEAALLPLLIISSFCGLALFEYPIGRLRPYLTYLYFLITWSFFTYLCYCLVNANYVPFFYMTWTNLLLMFFTIVSIPISLFYFKELKLCLHKLSIVDDTLEVLGIPKEYRQLHKWVIGIIIGWIVTVLFIDIYDIMWMNYTYFSIIRICVPFVANHLFHVSTFSALTWGIILGYASSRFQRINEHIYHLLENNVICTERPNELILNDQRKIETLECRRYMWIIMHVHLQLCVILRELNKVFGIQMALQMANYFMLSIDMCRIFYTSYINKDVTTFGQVLDGTFVYIFIALHSAKLLLLNHICQIVCDKANKTIAILYKLSNYNADKDLQDQILQFILQIKQRELKLSGMGLFEFGYNFIRKFYVSVATILVLIIQMHMIYTYDDDSSINDKNEANT